MFDDDTETGPYVRMTLRGIGEWITVKWDLAKDALYVGLDTAATQVFWDWPLWLAIPVGIGVLAVVLWLAAQFAEDLRTGKPEPLGWTIAFGVATFLSALVTFDLFVSMAVVDGTDGFLRIVYPIMTVLFGSYFFLCVAKRLRRG